MTEEERKRHINKLRITARRLMHSFGEGTFRTLFHGRGIEFATLREYVPGDDIRQIEWKITARRGTPYVKTFVEERDLTILLVVDLSSSMQVKWSSLAELAALITFLAEAHEDKIGCLGFTDQVEFFVPPEKNRRQPERILHLLLSQRNERRKTSIGNALLFLRRVLKKQSILFFLSDFLDRQFEQQFLALAAKHEIVGIYLYDPLETRLPENRVFECHDPETGKRMLLDSYDDRTRKEYSEFFQSQKQTLMRTFAAARSDLLITPAGKTTEHRFMNFLKVRQNSRIPVQLITERS